MKKIVIIGLWLILTVQNVNADAFGASNSVIILKLTSIYQAMKKFYRENVKILAEAKAQSSELKKLSTASRELQKEYYFAKNFSIQEELNMIEGDIRGLTSLHRLSGKTPQQKINILRAEIDRRFRASKTPEEREQYAQLKSHIESVDRLNKIKETKAKEAKEQGTVEQSQKNNIASIASSCALISAYYTAENQRKAEESMASDYRKIKQKGFENQFVESLEKLR